MHRTEGQYNVSNLFTDGPPGTRVEENWLNAVQEELCYLIEQAGIVLKTASSETKQQLYAAVNVLIASLISTHNAVTANPHGAVSTATANRLVVRDASGRAKFAAGAATGDAVVYSQFTNLKGTNGYQYLPGGIIIQWGTSLTGTLKSFPIAFPNNCYCILASEYGGVSRNVNVGTNTYTDTTFTLTGTGGDSVTWIAIGW